MEGILFKPDMIQADVRAERLQEIADKDADVEGFYDPQDSVRSVVRFADYWDSINKDYPFESNPWVWVYGFQLKQVT